MNSDQYLEMGQLPKGIRIQHPDRMDLNDVYSLARHLASKIETVPMLPFRPLEDFKALQPLQPVENTHRIAALKAQQKGKENTSTPDGTADDTTTGDDDDVLGVYNSALPPIPDEVDDDEEPFSDLGA